MTPKMLQERCPWLNTDGIAIGCYGRTVGSMHAAFRVSCLAGLQNEGWLDPWALLTAFRQKAASLGVLYLNGGCEQRER